MANKPHSRLANILREDTVQRTPYSLCDDKGTVTYEPGEVGKIFPDFFFCIYSLPDMLPANAQKRRDLMQDFLSLFALPKLTSEAQFLPMRSLEIPP